MFSMLWWEGEVTVVMSISCCFFGPPENQTCVCEFCVVLTVKFWSEKRHVIHFAPPLLNHPGWRDLISVYVGGAGSAHRGDTCLGAFIHLIGFAHGLHGSHDVSECLLHGLL